MPSDNRSVIPKPIYAFVRSLLRRISLRGNVSTGPEFRAGMGSIVSAPHSLIIGTNVSVGPMSVFQCDGIIGDYTMIGMGVHVVGREDHATDEVGVPMIESTWVGDRSPRSRDEVYIGTDVWIGANSVILSGIRIGDCAIVGAGAVVTSDVPPFAIVVGNPARPVNYRFSSEEDRSAHLIALENRREN